MSVLSWYLNRLRAMSPREVLWRLGQKRLQRAEKRRYRSRVPVCDLPFSFRTFPELPSERELARGIHIPAPEYRVEGEAIRLLGPFRYEDYAEQWHAGFNTPAAWPLLPSYDLRYKQRDDIGDARINWELNRHRQFTRLAASDDTDRLARLLDNWNRENPFLWGISWTSPMEIAIRSISWMMSARLIAARLTGEQETPASGTQDKEREKSSQLIEKLLRGAANMTDYLSRHMSGFSSANNHLIVEATAVVMAGLLFGRGEWVDHNIEILDRELRRQVSADGVDLESSLHYHGFVLEAYLLLCREMKLLGMEIPAGWAERLGGMAAFIRSSHCGKLVFGDDDEARIVDFGFGDFNYYRYLLQFHSLLFTPAGSSERVAAGICSGPAPTLRYLFPEDEFRCGSSEGSAADSLPSPGSSPEHGSAAKGEHYPEGGYTFLESGDFSVAVDHAPLGFGNIAAHAHSDILSFQLLYRGQPFLVDSGTYLYHIGAAMRDRLRGSMMHNTVTVDSLDQARMLGAFLWGSKPEVGPVSYSAADNYLESSVRGLSGVRHTRAFRLDGGELTLTDSFDRDCSWTATFILAPGLDADLSEGSALIGGKLRLTTSSGSLQAETVEIAPRYGELVPAVALRIIGDSRENIVTLRSV